MSWLSKTLGLDSRREAADLSRQQLRSAADEERSGMGWRNAFQETAGATYNRMLPQLRQGLQLTREQGVRRGVSTGDLGTSEEGDLASAFSRNLADTLGSLSMGGYQQSRGRYLDLLSGNADRDQDESNSYRNFLASLFGGVTRAGAMAVGGGTPAGTIAASAL